MSTRIDYVKIAFTGDVSNAINWKNRMFRYVDAFCEPRGVQVATFCTSDRYYDNHANVWVDYFEVWGEAADAFFNDLLPGDFGSIMRIDYRTQFDAPAISMLDLERIITNNKKGSRKTITRINSPIRTKKKGRDAGGDFLAVGSRGSDRRTAIYKRGNEPWAVEVQFGKKMPRLILQEANRLCEEHDYLYITLAYRRALEMAFREAVGDHLYYTIDQIVGTDPIYEQMEQQTQQEQLLLQFDFLYEQMDDNAREVVAELVIAERNNSAIIEEDDDDDDFSNVMSLVNG